MKLCPCYFELLYYEELLTSLQLTQMLRDQLQESQRLGEALRMEREIYVNINQVGHAPQRYNF